MASTKDVIAYTWARYPHKKELLLESLVDAPNRLAQLVYLLDWRSCITRGRPLTESNWRIDARLGPIDLDVLRLAATTINRGEDYAKRQVADANLTREEVELMNFVLETAAGKGSADLERLVNSTYPVLVQDEGRVLDLSTLAEEYKAQRPLISV